MKLSAIDIAIILGYFLTVILIGLWVSRRGAKDLDSYFLGSKSLPWYLLGISDASGMFDISGTMWMVYILFMYGLKSIWLPFLWPVFNQIFLMMFLSGWLRRSNVLTGAEWIQTRFGRGTGASLAHLSVVFFALVNVIGMLAYASKGIGKFAVVMLPWRFTGASEGLLSDENIYAIIILGLTSLYAIKGGMISVVITEVMQFTILTVTSITIGIIAICKVSPAMIHNAIPAGWSNPFFGWKLGLDWTGILDKVNDAILKRFYKTVNPWGAWGPIRDQVMRDDPAFQTNRDCRRDCANVMVGIVWQLCLTALPIYLVLRQWSWAGAIAATLGITSLIIKFNWYDKLEKAPAGSVRREQPLPAQTTTL